MGKAGAGLNGPAGAMGGPAGAMGGPGAPIGGPGMGPGMGMDMMGPGMGGMGPAMGEGPPLGGPMGMDDEPPPTRFRPPQEETNTLYIDNLPNDVKKRELAHVFRACPGYRVRTA